VFEFVRQVGGMPFAASKGWDRGRFSTGKDAADRRTFYECYAKHSPADRVWAYNVNTEFWKQWSQERFTTETFSESNQMNDGALSLFVPSSPKEHLAFSHHMTSEERQSLFVEGKGIVTKWVVKNKNNHWLDAVALACAAAGVLGVRLIQRDSLTTSTKTAPRPEAPQRKLLTPHGKPFLITER
jgi:hypothetical protein